MAWLTGAGAVVTLFVVFGVVLYPSPHPLPEIFSGAAQVDTSGHMHLTAVERRKIEASVDRFALAALDRSDPGTAWDLAGPDMRGTSARADWIAGKMPVGLFPTGGKHFPGWNHISASRGEVSFDVLIQPRHGAKVGATAFGVQAIRRNGGWVVNRWYPLAVFTAVGTTKHPHIVGPYDYGAAGRGAGQVDHGRINPWWLLVPAALFALGLLVVAFIVLRNWRRYRRMRAEVRAEYADDMRRG